MNCAATTEDPHDLGVRLATANAPAFVMMNHSMPAAEREIFIRGFLACISGMCEQAIGHAATVQVLQDTAQLRPVAAIDRGAGGKFEDFVSELDD